MSGEDVIANGRVGPGQGADGAENPLRLGRTLEQIVADAHARYYEATARGGVYFATIGSAGVAPGTALSTTPPFALWNPPNSGFNLAILKAYLTYISGTLGLGSIYYASVVGQQSKPTGGTQLVVQSALTNGKTGVAQAFTASTVANTPVAICPGFFLPPYAGAVGPPTPPWRDEIAGMIVIPPGACFVMQEIGAAGTAPLVVLAAGWDEAPV